MALKFGRKTGITSYVDGKGQVHYTEEEYDAYQNALSAEKQRRSDYDASVSSYQSALDLYENGPKTKLPVSGGVSLSRGKTRGKDISFEEGQAITPKETNKYLDERIKSGELIKLSHPSIDATTRSYMSQMSGVFGKQLDSGDYDSEVYVPKGTKVKGWSDIYGENFNPVEFEKATKSGKFDEYANKNNIQPGQFFTPNISPQRKYKTPKDPGKYVENAPIKDINVDQVDWKPMANMPAKKAFITQKTGKLKGGPAAPEEWSAPGKIGERINKSDMLWNDAGSKAIHQGSGKRLKDQMVAGAKSRTKALFTNPNKEYNREAKTSAAYFGDNVFEGSVTGKNAAELKDMKKTTKQTRNEALARGSFKSAVELQKDVKQLRRAGEYAEKGDIIKQYGTGKIIEGQNSKLKHFTAEGTKSVRGDKGIYEREAGAMAGYKESQAYKKQQAFSEARSNFKSSTDNMANANSMRKKQESLSGTDSFISPTRAIKMEKKASNPGMTNREAGQAARSQRKEERGIMKALDKKMKTN